MSTRLERMVAIIDIINRQRCPSVNLLCEKFEVQPRTIHEDIRFLKDRLGMAIKYDRSKEGYVNEDPAKKLPQFELTDGEVFALTLGKDMLAQYTGTSLEPILQSAIEKIICRLPDKVRLDFSDVKSVVKFHATGIVPISKKMFMDLNAACEKSSPATITYYATSSGETTSRKIDPYRLVEHKGTWYVVAHCHHRNDLRMFALHRIREYEVLNEKFAVSDGLDVDNWIESAFQLEHGDGERTVKVQFQPKAARYVVERNWHPSQKLTTYDDGSCLLEFVTHSIEEAKRWILTFGGEAMVLEPEELRAAIRKDFERALVGYFENFGNGVEKPAMEIRSESGVRDFERL